MTTAPETRTGGQILVDALVRHGVEIAFAVAGESYLEVLDALYDKRNAIRLITCRQEGGSAFMAEAYGKLTGKPGVCLVTRGPGACNASIGVHTAQQDSTPMILLVGQVASDQVEREAFQEIDYRRMFGSVAKWAAQIDRVDRIPEFMARAFHVATSGRPGPVVLALPEDMLRATAAVADTKPYQVVRPRPGAADLAEVRRMLAAAERPVMLVGGSGGTDEAARAATAFAEANDLPVCCSFRRQDIVSNASRCYIGDLGTGPAATLLKRVAEADLVLAVGARLGEITSQGYSLFESPEPRQTLIHVHPDADELGRVFRPTLALQSGAAEFALALGALAPVEKPRWAEWRAAARAEHVATLTPGPYTGDLDLGAVMMFLRDRLPKDAVVTVDAGNFSGWPQRFLDFGRPGRQLGPTNGAMGYSVPAGVAASLIHPGRMVVSFVGDGGVMMTGQELATAIRHGAAPIILIFNNGMYGTIRMHQEKRHPHRVSGTELTNPDFAAWAQSFGAFGATVTRTEEFAPAFERAVAARTAAVIELRTDPEIISTRTTISALRSAAKGG